MTELKNAKNLPKNSVNSQDMIQDFIKQNKRYIKFLFVKDFQTGFDVMPQFFPIYRHIILVHPVGVKDWSTDSFIFFDIGKVSKLEKKHEFVIFNFSRI